MLGSRATPGTELPRPTEGYGLLALAVSEH